MWWVWLVVKLVGEGVALFFEEMVVVNVCYTRSNFACSEGLIFAAGYDA